MQQYNEDEDTQYTYFSNSLQIVLFSLNTINFFADDIIGTVCIFADTHSN